MRMSRGLHRFAAFCSMLAVVAFATWFSAAANGAVASNAPTDRPLHISLTKAEPGINDTIAASPASLKLWFSGAVQAAVTGARVTGPGDRAVAMGAMHADSVPRMPAVATFAETLGPGTYTVAWRTMAGDGHPANGSFVFVVRRAEK